MPDSSQIPVLVIENDPQVLKLITTVLSGAGYRVLAARSPAHALELKQKGGPPVQLVIVDDPSGRSAFEPAHKVLLLYKPFRPASLLRDVRKALD
jgi:response regulator RpfG family c-di-GMP phosphodiesterase